MKLDLASQIPPLQLKNLKIPRLKMLNLIIHKILKVMQILGWSKATAHYMICQQISKSIIQPWQTLWYVHTCFDFHVKMKMGLLESVWGERSVKCENKMNAHWFFFPYAETCGQFSILSIKVCCAIENWKQKII